MARPKKKSLEEQLCYKQEEYISARKHCDELAKEIEKLSCLVKEEKMKALMSALERSVKSYEDVMAFISAGTTKSDDD